MTLYEALADVYTSCDRAITYVILKEAVKQLTPEQVKYIEDSLEVLYLGVHNDTNTTPCN